MAAAASISVTQSVVEILTLSPSSKIQTTQVVTELLSQAPSLIVDATQVTVETLSFTPGRIIKPTQIATEILTIGSTPPVATNFIMDCPTSNLIITGTHLDNYRFIQLTSNGQPVPYTVVYVTPTQILIHIPNFVNGTYSVRVT